MPKSPSPELVRLIRRRLDAVAATVERAALRVWQTGELEPLVDVVLNGQRATVTATDAGLSLAAGVTTGTTTRPLGIDPEPLIGRHARNGTLLEAVYSRPDRAVRESGFQAGAALLRRLIQTDMQLAHRQAAHAHAMADRRVAAWRRVTAATACGLCIAASTRTYRRGDLLPIHARCSCRVVEVYSDQPVPQGAFVDRAALAHVYEEAGGTDFRSLVGVRFDLDSLPSDLAEQIAPLNVSVAIDPELGPVLTGSRHDTKFTL